MKKIIFITAVVLSALLFSCTTVYNTGSGSTDSNLTVGKVQREIKKGMSGAEVAEALGSPNIVTQDANGDETWVYDKIATEANYTSNSDGLFLILYGKTSTQQTASVTQKTLTVVIKYDNNKKVKEFSYHSSKF